MKIPDSIDERQKMFEFKEKPVVAGILLDFLLDVLLMPYRFVNYLTLKIELEKKLLVSNCVNHVLKGARSRYFK